HLPRGVVEEVGATAVRSGVARDQAVAAALWVFARLGMNERAALIREYVAESATAAAAQSRRTAS
ncbi:MAG: hypothetical protein ACRD36_07585, partial [Candidatus Acidiferrum sp.]